MSVQEDIHEKRCRVQDGYKTVETTWHQRNDLFIINLDLQKFLADVENLDSWIQKKTPQVTSKTCGVWKFSLFLVDAFCGAKNARLLQ